MKITFVTGLLSGTKTANVARQVDLNKTNDCIGALSETLEKVNRRLNAVEKRLTNLEKALASVDTRLRDECKDIFSDVIERAMSPAFAAMGQLMPTNGGGNSTVESSAKRKKTQQNKLDKKVGTTKCIKEKA